MSKVAELKKIKKGAIKEILGDKTTTSLEKLATIEENGLWDFSDWVNEEFPEWEQECCDLERQATIDAGKDPETEHVCTITDTVFDPSWADHGRGATVSYVSIMRDYLWRFNRNASEEDKAEFKKTGKIPLSDTMVVVSNRGDYNSKVVKPVQEVIDRICEFCIKEKVIGYTNDW